MRKAGTGRVRLLRLLLCATCLLGGILGLLWLNSALAQATASVSGWVVDADAFPACREVHFTLDLETTGEEKVTELKDVIASHQGESKIFFHVKEGTQRACVIRSRTQGVKLDYDLVSTLCESIGAENIRVVPSAMGA